MAADHDVVVRQSGTILGDLCLPEASRGSALRWPRGSCISGVTTSAQHIFRRISAGIRACRTISSGSCEPDITTSAQHIFRRISSRIRACRRFRPARRRLDTGGGLGSRQLYAFRRFRPTRRRLDTGGDLWLAAALPSRIRRTCAAHSVPLGYRSRGRRREAPVAVRPN